MTITKEEALVLLNYIYRLESFAEASGYDKKYTPEVNQVVEKIQEIK